jgi:hypothetical protein
MPGALGVTYSVVEKILIENLRLARYLMDALADRR